MQSRTGKALPRRPAFSRNARTLLWIDRFVGFPVCLMLTAVRRIADFFRGSGATSAPRSLLFLKLAEQGSTVLAYDAIRTAVERFGREHVFFLVFEENRFVVDVLGLIPEQNVLTVRTRSAWSMMSSAIARLLEVRRRGIDCCIDLEFFTRTSAALCYLTGAKHRVGFHAYFRESPYRGDLLTHRILYNPHWHTSRSFTSLVRALNMDPRRFPTFDFVASPPTTPPRFRPDPSEQDSVRRILTELGVPGDGRIVLLNANASDLVPLRRWEKTNYIALARKLIAEFSDLYIGFTGAADEEPAVSELVREVDSPRCVCLAGRTTLRELLVAYGLAEVLVTNDSGPAHFAALTEIDVVALFGPETPLLFAAPGARTHALWAGIACSPCVNAFNSRQTACRDNVCMKSITVDQVLDIVRRIYLERMAVGSRNL